jgi:hypothetical protein
MKTLHLLGLSAVMSALLIFAAAEADAQQQSVGGARNNFHSRGNHFSWERGHGFRGGFGGVFVVEREVPVYIEKEAPPPPAAVPLPQDSGGGDKPRKPYVIGSTYASLPGSCMKMIDEGVSYYLCSGEWYRQIGGGRDSKYKAVGKP